MSLPKLKKIRVLNENEMKDFTGGKIPCTFGCSSCSESCSTCSPGNASGGTKPKELK